MARNTIGRTWPMELGLLVGLAALLLGLAIGGHGGPDGLEGWHKAARWTARAGFPLLILTYSASSLGRLWPGSLTRSLWRDRRWWGLGFAACHTVHLFALVTLLRLAHTSPVHITLVVGGAGYVLLLAMVLTSNQAAMRALGRNWKRLHALGIHWLWLVFFLSYLKRITLPAAHVEGVIGTAIALLALGLRIAVMVRDRRGRAAFA